MKKILTVFIAFALAFMLFQPVMAAHDIVNIGSEFVRALIKKDDEQVKTYLTTNVVIPEISENTPINRVTGLPSPKENVSVSIAYFDDGKSMEERIAFIWELTFKEDKITDIKVVYDGSNPFMNESNLINEFEGKSKTNVLTVSDFPFEITHIDGDVNKGILVLNYRNADLKGLLQVKVERNDESLEEFKNKDNHYYTLKNEIKALYHPNNLLIFQNKNLLYSISIESSMNLNFKVDDYLKIANSMF
ncbi:hypothetical protein JOD29_000520 [Lysinibacillus composti]|uniref:DUF4367 domain-containing protein n=1 Tax=Lysinibacillus composti TaxID=720633 RepID=A0A3N9UJF2_9BACI|nr:hypothetical protein [Lysinibacillus composti]MBM7607283.1 hypothetical protein [Lysinibacillus composti]RQW76143.1 hypothetical protein EBB45_00910 [Lysinibacillus composti]